MSAEVLGILSLLIATAIASGAFYLDVRVEELTGRPQMFLLGGLVLSVLLTALACWLWPEAARELENRYLS